MSFEVTDKTSATEPYAAAKPPFRGWYILAVTALAQAITIGCTNYIYSLYTLPISTEFGASRTSMGAGMAIFLLSMGVYSPILGPLMDKHNKRNLMVLGGVLMATGFALLSQATALWQMAVVLVLFIASGSGLMGTLAASTILANWFERYRGRALGISAMGASLGGAVMPVVAAALIQSIGWRNSLLVIAAGIAAIALVVIRFVIVNAPRDIGQYMDGVVPVETEAQVAAAKKPIPPFNLIELLKDSNFWCITLCTSLVMFAGVLLSVHFVPYAKELGISTTAASFVLSLFAVAGMFGKVFFGWLTDIFNAGKVFVVVALIDATAWGLLLTDLNYTMFLVGVGIMGFGAGGAAPVMTSAMAKCFGSQRLGRVMGFVGVLLLLLIALPGPVGGYIYDKTGSYHLVFSWTFWLFPLAALIAWFIRIPESAQGVRVDRSALRH